MIYAFLLKRISLGSCATRPKLANEPNSPARVNTASGSGPKAGLIKGKLSIDSDCTGYRYHSTQPWTKKHDLLFLTNKLWSET